MEEIVSKKQCTGCTACLNVCSKKAIEMIEDKNGFKFPKIDESKCIKCGGCKKICPVLNTDKNKSLNKCFVGYAKNKKYKEGASSGGIFPLIATHILNNNGIVIGAAFDENMKLKHTAITNNEDLNKLKGSKYIQSDLVDIFCYIKENIEKKKVLFVGTPCQVAGLKSYINNDYDNLICIDLICHGVPSPKLFDKYIKELEDINGKLLEYNFRDKCTGWDNYSNTMIFENRKITELRSNNKYMKLFLSDWALRESCYNCDFKLENKYSDLTLGDFWGVKKHYPEIYDENGVSAIIVNTERGLSLFNIINEYMIYKECELEKIIEGNRSLVNSAKEKNDRKRFFDDLDQISISKLSKKYCKHNGIIKRMIIFLKIIIKKVIT